MRSSKSPKSVKSRLTRLDLSQAIHGGRPFPRQTEMGRRRRPIAMFALALGAFGIGTTEFVSMGLLPMIAGDFGISEAHAGHVVTAYALGVVIGAPLITTLTGRFPRRRLIIVLMAAFILGNLLTVFAGSYEMLILARFIAGFPHGAYFAIANLIAASMAEPGKRGQAVARVSLGLAVATVLGVPAAQWLGQAYGWNVAYALVVVIGMFCFAGLWHAVPHMTLMPPTRPSQEIGALANPQVLLSFAAASIGFGGMFCVYTYISWTMTDRAGLSADLIWFVLMVYGIGMVVGNWLGGRLADINIEWAVIGSFVTMAVLLVAFFFASMNASLAIALFGVLSIGGGVLTVNMQTRFMDVAGKAQNLAASMNQAAFNIANGAGAAVGGAVIAAGFNYSYPALAGAALALGGLVIFIPAVILRRRQLRNEPRVQLESSEEQHV